MIRQSLRKQSIETMKKTSTRQLLQWLNYARKCGGGFWSPSGSSGKYGYRWDDLKKELATREHIPNKKEAKALRRAAAQGKIR